MDESLEKVLRNSLRQTEKREYVFKLLFLSEFYSESERAEQQAIYLEGEPISHELVTELMLRYDKVKAEMGRLDTILTQASVGWDLTRMGKVELNIMRLAAYEILCDQEIPTSVAINEAIELSKRFGGAQSGSFVNAILSKVEKSNGSTKL